jgi:hypothetical protein
MIKDFAIGRQHDAVIFTMEWLHPIGQIYNRQPLEDKAQIIIEIGCLAIRSPTRHLRSHAA